MTTEKKDLAKQDYDWMAIAAAEKVYLKDQLAYRILSGPHAGMVVSKRRLKLETEGRMMFEQAASLREMVD